MFTEFTFGRSGQHGLFSE